jgi:hypothetical protein
VLHTTCVATRLFAGHADNALPQVAVALVNAGSSRTNRWTASRHGFVGWWRTRRFISSGSGRHARVRPLRSARRHGPGRGAGPEVLAQSADRARNVHRATDGLYTRNAGIPTTVSRRCSTI